LEFEFRVTLTFFGFPFLEVRKMQKNSRIALCGLLVIAFAMGGLFLVGNVEGQFGGGSRLMELTPSISTSQAVTTQSPMPLGKMVKAFQRLLGVLKVTSSPTGGSGATLDVWYQFSADGGLTWQDFAEVHVTQGSTGTYFIPVSAVTAGPTTIPSISDGQLGNNVIVQGPLGDTLRIKYSANMGSGTAGNWSFQAFAVPD
jgi:hypothetical protein